MLVWLPKLKIVTLTDHVFSPSSRFRIRQYTPILHKAGINVDDFYRKISTETAAPRDGHIRIRDSSRLILKALMHESANVANRLSESVKANNYDLVWLSRQLIIGYPTFEYLIRKPLIYDIDDAIFLSGDLANLQFKISARRAAAVIAGNEFLAETASKYSNNITIIPTAVDTQRWKPHSKGNESTINVDQFSIGWSGTSSSFKYFLSIEKEIKQFLSDFPSAKLLFMADRFPNELKVLAPYVNFVKWSVESEVDFIQSLDVGLMPIANDMWSKGKCAYKSLLYAACGIPIVITPIGANQKLLNQSDVGFGPNNPKEWYEILSLLFFDRSLGKLMGKNGISLVEKNYSLNACAPKLIEILKNSL